MVFKKAKSLNSQRTDSYRLKSKDNKINIKSNIFKTNKPHNDGKYTEILDYEYHCVFFEFFDCEGTNYRETFLCMGCKVKPTKRYLDFKI